MVARGEIGFLIASVGEEKGVFVAATAPTIEKDTEVVVSEIYLVVIWAIMLCTIVGPIAVGILVRRMNSFPARSIPLG